jgi:uncharacterized protein (TIGR02271 family)
MKEKTTDKNPQNRDPITGAPGSHPIGTGVGAAGVAGAIAAGAAAGTAVGPVGTAAGAVVGALAGGLAGKGVAEAVNPTEEEAYWRENHARQPYARERGYDHYRDAYEIGYRGYSRYGTSGKTFEDYDEDFRRDYEQRGGSDRLPWEEARLASKAAWSRLETSSDDYSRLIDFDVRDVEDRKVGVVHNLWIDEQGQPVFLGVKTGWLFGKNHVVPVHTAQVNNSQRVIRLPFTEDTIKNAPSHDADAEIADAEVQRIFEYYGVSAAPTPVEATSQKAAKTSTSTAAAGTSRTAESASVKLHQEELKVGKREVEAGGVRLRKVIRTETINQPVELRREEIVFERVSGEAARAGEDEGAFREEDIYIPLRREEAVVQKQTRVREEVRVGKRADVERESVSDEVRSEDVEIEETAETRR